MAGLTDISYLHTPRNQPFLYTTVTQLAQENALVYPDMELLVLREVDGSRSSLTNASLYIKAEQLAKYLVKQGVTRGDYVGLVGPNSLEMAVGTLGIMLAGAVVLNINISMKTALDVKEQLRLVNAKLVMVDCGKDNSLLPLVKAMLDNCVIHTENNACDETFMVFCLRKIALGDLMKAETLESVYQLKLDEVVLPDINPEDIAIVFASSGSTGTPKKAGHTHYSFINSRERLTFNSADARIIRFSVNSFQWLSGSFLFSIIRNETRITTDTAESIKNLNAEFLWRVVSDENCTDATLLPYVINDLLELPDSFTEDGFRLQRLVTGGQIIGSFYKRVVGKICHDFVISYGSTESKVITAYTYSDISSRFEVGNVGRPWPGVEVRVVDDRDIPVRRGVAGHVQVRSPYVMKEYVGNPQLTADAFAEGKWYRTGDNGKVSTAGNLILLGREVEIISRAGNKIYPSSIELFLKQMESIEEICVVAVPDRRLYEEICVCYTSYIKTSPDDVRNFFELRLFKKNTFDSLGDMPSYFLRFDAFPKLCNGKLDRKAIRLNAISRL
ncbi:medium-chain acyl-CoA ligase ACSF2, mitochondrial-like [Argopecten irradians]|uniref:medium-chain acyl-CoA ligase ACSF2, mitochondrial-like n=1 Tax=Argopecten irradians TaxID=31199 RepID=UPI0037219F03